MNNQGNRRQGKNDKLKDQYKVNDNIRAREVRIVGEGLESKVYTIQQALRLAEERGEDLVEISPNAEPPVCRIIDFSKFIYQQKQKAKEQKAKQIKVNVKEIRFGPQTDLEDCAKVDQLPVLEGKRMIIFLSPKKREIKVKSTPVKVEAESQSASAVVNTVESAPSESSEAQAE